MGIVTIHFLPDEYRKLQADQITAGDFIDKTLRQDIAPICDLLKYNHLDDGGSPEVDDFQIKELFYNPATQSGNVQLAYDIRFFWGCSGIKKTHAYKERCPFVINPLTATLMLTIPENLVRDTHDEF